MRFCLISFAFCGSLLLLTNQPTEAGTLYLSHLQQVTAVSEDGSKRFADATHGFFIGNGSKGKQPSLAMLLNSGTKKNEPVLMFEATGNKSNTSIHISETGMFSTTATFATLPDGSLDLSSDPIQTVDSLQGTVVTRTQDWEMVGEKSNIDPASYPFSSISLSSGNTQGELVLDRNGDHAVPLSGTYVLALKAANAYAVYAFQNLSGVTQFNFDFRADDSEFKWGLSNVELFYGGPSSNRGPSFDGSDPKTAPEPSSWAIFALAGIGMGWFTVRRRKNLAVPGAEAQ